MEKGVCNPFAQPQSSLQSSVKGLQTPFSILSHQLLDFIRLDGDVCHEIGVFGLSDEVVVLKADADVLGGDVDAGLGW